MVARNKRYRLMTDGNENNDYVPTGADLSRLKDKMHAATAEFKEACAYMNEDKEQARRDRETAILKKQVLDLNDKFDYFICMMLKANNMPVEDISPEAIAKAAVPKKGKESPKFAISDSIVLPDEEFEGDGKGATVELFKEFNINAIEANLGNRKVFRQEGNSEGDLKKMGTAWLNRLADL